MPLTYIGPAEIQDGGGELFYVRRITAPPPAAPVADPWPVATRLRVQILRLTDPTPTYAVVAEALNGRPGEREPDPLAPATTVYLQRPEPDSEDSEEARSRVRAYAPTLAQGLYYLRVSYWDVGAGAWVSEGECGPVRVLPRALWSETYQGRAKFPGVYPAGIREMGDEPLVVL